MPFLSFTIKGEFLLTGNYYGDVVIYDTDSGEKISKYNCHHIPCKLVKFSQSFLMFVSASDSVVLWIPKFTDN